VSFIEQLEQELRTRRVPAAVRRRILLEYADHIASDRESEAERLGDPGELAGQLAAELATDEARRTTRNTFLALSAAAVALVVGQLAIGHAGGYRGPSNGHSLALWIPAILAILCAPQVALVTGLLAAGRALLRRRAVVLPDAEVALIHRRCLTGAVAGMVTCAGLLLYTINFSGELASWWVWTQAAMAAGAGAGVGWAIPGSLRSSVYLAGTRFAGISPLPTRQWLRTLRTRSWSAAGLAAGLVVVATTLFTAHAERSLIEGLERGGFEAVFIAAGLALSRCCAARWRFR
jgi:hypothetical protein